MRCYDDISRKENFLIVGFVFGIPADFSFGGEGREIEIDLSILCIEPMNPNDEIIFDLHIGACRKRACKVLLAAWERIVNVLWDEKGFPSDMRTDFLYNGLFDDGECLYRLGV